MTLLMALVLSRASSAQILSPTHNRTRWAAQVSPTNALPEYPRPQLVRSRWTTLNGTWEYAITDRRAGQPKTWEGTILVPFAIQSQLSTVERAVSDSERLWYHRTFTATAPARGGRLLLHFGAVDWDATIFVNGKRIGQHLGGYDPFTFDITDALNSGGKQDLVVSVWDPTDKGPQPRGKQVLKPNGIWYTAVTGIWQTVWLEPVSPAHVDDVVVTPDIDAGTARVHVSGVSGGRNIEVIVTASSNGRTVNQVRGPLGSDLTLSIPAPHLWSPTDPFLYDLRVVLHVADVGYDDVKSYFGMRKISLAKDSAGVTRLFLNNKPLFQYGMLDQGWWPDGLYTAPTDSALRFDIATMKSWGFNMIRKHVKVEPARWYYHADKLGMLVWQDMPSGDNNTAEGKQEYEAELHQMVDALRSHPSIVMWVPFNEGWGQFDTEKYVSWLKGYDPSRLVNNASGWTDKKVGDVSDVHSYPGPDMPKLEPNRAAVLGEFGGLGLPLAGHTWLLQNNWGYRSFTTQESLGAAYKDLISQMRYLIADGLSAAVYTQTTDVEIEVNGLMTYDRAVMKLPADATAANKTLYGPPPVVKSVVPTSLLDGQQWHYTTAAPPGDWFAVGFVDAAWQQGPGGFGTARTPGAVVRTAWNSSDIWLRRTFTLNSTALVAPQWRIHHDEDAELYLNGVLVASLSGYTSGYTRIPLDAKAIAQLRTGLNTLAVHVHQTTGGQYIDVGLEERIRP